MRVVGLVAAVVCCVAGAGTAQAEDWSGFYAGVIGSAGQFGSTGILVDTPTSGTGAIGGIFAGYAVDAGSLQVGAELGLFSSAPSVTEWETELSGITYYSTDTVDRGPLLTMNARIGLPVGNVLLAVSGGVATAEATAQRVNVDENGFYQPSFNFSGSARHIGYNIAASVETRLAEHVTLGVEFRHFDLGEQTYEFDNGGHATLSLTEQRIGVRLGVIFP